MSQTKTPFQITKERFMRLGLVTVKNPFVYVLVACLLATYIAPGTTPIVMLGKDATTWANWFLSLMSLWWAVNFAIFMTRNDRYAKSDELVVVNNETVRDEVIGNRQDVWLYVGATLVLLAIGLVQQFVVGGANIVILLFLLLLQLAPLAGGTSLQEQAMHEGKYISTFFLILLIAFVLVFGPRPFQMQVAVAAPKPQQAGVLPTLTPQPTLAPKPSTVPTTVPTKAAASTPTKVVMLCPPGLIPSTAKDKPTWLENPLGSNRFVEFKDLPLVGSEKLDGTFKEIAGQLFCQTDRKNANYPLWWKVK